MAGEVGTGLRIGGLVDERGVLMPERAEIRIGDQSWGEICAAKTHPEIGLDELASVVSRALVEIERRQALAIESARDELTDFASAGTFQDGLARAIRHSDRYDLPLCLVLFDIDTLAEVNRRHGRAIGDDVIAEVAARARGVARASDMLARVGGEEFAWVMPGAGASEGGHAAERLRIGIAEQPFGEAGSMSVSVGVAEWAGELSADDLFAAADAALHQAKTGGRNRVFRSDRIPPEPERAAAAASVREQALVALRALARAVDAKDPSTHRHSTRVARIAERLAEEIGWPAEDLRRISDAGVLHDVGKLLVPDAILAKAGPLDDEEFAEVMRHPGSGADIASEVLDSDQTSWVRHHHERWDGTGYPDRLTGPAIPLGARLIAVADAWDVMTRARHYREPMSSEEALRELAAHAGTQFDPELSAALARLAERGALDSGPVEISAGGADD